MIQKLRRIANQGFQNFHFLYDKAYPNTAQQTQQTLSNLGITVVPHLPPSKYYLSSSMKAALSGVEQVNTVLDQWIESKQAVFLALEFICYLKDVKGVSMQEHD